MLFEDVLKRFNFMFQVKPDLQDIFSTIEKNIHLVEEKQKYAIICLNYIEEYISRRNPITLLTSIGLLSLAGNHNLITNQRHIDQFELDFIMALTLKYCTKKSFYCKDFDINDQNKLLKAIVIYTYCVQHELHNNNLNAFVLNLHFRTSRLTEFDNEKLNIIIEFCQKFDQGNKKDEVKLSNVIEFILEMDKIVGKRLEKILGQEVNLADQNKFFVYTLEDIRKICERYNFNYTKVVEIVEKFCCQFGDLKDIAVEEIYLNNPIYKKFIVKIEPELFFLPNLSVVIENLFEIIREIITINEQNSQKYSKIKAEYLEEKTFNLIQSKFGNAGKIYLNSQWERERHGENDCTLVYENYAIVFEVKSGYINYNTNKGILKSAYSDNKKLVEETSQQAISFMDFLKDNLGTVLELKVKGGSSNKIDLRKVNNVIAIGVIFEVTPLQNLKLSTNKHIPIVNIFQLNKIFSCFERAEVFDYFIKRSYFEKNVMYLGDEYDLIYTYLVSGLNTFDKLYEKSKCDEKVFLHYKEGIITRDDLIRDKKYQRILDAVIEEEGENYLEKMISLLELSPLVQKQIMRDIVNEKELALTDNIKSRKKILVVRLLEFYNSNTNKEIENDLQIYAKKCIDFSNFLFIAFTKDMGHVVVKVIKEGTLLC